MNKNGFCSFKGFFPKNTNSMAAVVPALGDIKLKISGM